MPELPDSVILEIFNYLPKRELFTVSKVSKRWRRISTDRSLWTTISVGELNVPEQKLSDNFLKLLLDNAKSVTSVVLPECILLTNKSLLSLSLSSQNLQHLNLCGCYKVADRGILTLAKHCATLKTVNLHNTLVSDDGLCRLLSQNLGITELVASTNAMSEKTFQVMAGHCKELEMLHVEPNQIHGLKTKLNSKFNKLTSDMLLVLAINCPKLVVLILQYELTQICNWVVAFLGHQCGQLECIELGELDKSSLLTDAGIINMCMPLKNLRRFVLNKAAVTDLTLFAISTQCTGLMDLDLQESQNISDMGVISLLKSCTFLESLHLGNNAHGHLTNASAIAMSQSVCAKQMISLSMNSWDITNFGLFVLSCNLINLRHLSIANCQNITLEGLKETLYLFSNLMTLDLSYTNCFSCDTELLSVAHLFTNLHELKLVGCHGLTEKSIIKLQSGLPFCNIICSINF